MQDGILQFINNLESADTKITELVHNTLEFEARHIADAVRVQLASGIDGDGNRVYLMRHGSKHYEYSWNTVTKKEKRSDLAGVWWRITNYDSGAFYDSIYVDILGNYDFEVRASDWKYELIKERSGENIINLSQEGAQFLFTEEIAPMLQAGVNAIYFGEY